MMEKPAINTEFLGCFGKLKKRHKTRWIVIHHTCTASPSKTRSALKKKGLSTHFEVDVDGTVYQYADLTRECAHCGSNNHQTVSVDLTHKEGAEWPSVQLNATKRLFVWLAEELKLPLFLYTDLPAGFVYHRAIGNTACPDNFPGEALFSEIGARKC